MIAPVIPVLASTWLADLSRAASSSLISAIWQGAILAAVVAIVLRIVPEIPAAARFSIWLSVFALIAALPFLRVGPHAALVQPQPASGAWLTVDARWTLAIVAVWGIASLVRAVTLAAAALRVRRLWKRALPVDGLAPATVGTRHALVCASQDVDRPTVIGFFSPRILIPAWLLEKLTAAELEQVVLHEAGHLGRADDWMNLLQKIALVLFPLNPVLAWVERRLCFERELACDEKVVALLAHRERAATDYASCLATLAEYRLERCSLVRNLALALGALGRESELGRRVRRILRPSVKMRPWHTRLVMGGAMLSLLFAATELERCPQVVGFAAPAGATRLAASSAEPISLLPGYRAVSARMNLPQPHAVESHGDAPPQLTGSRVDHAVAHNSPHDTMSPQPHAIRTIARPAHHEAAPQLAEVREPGMVVTRWTITEWPGGNEVRVVQTSAAMTRTALPAQSHNVIDRRSSAPREDTASAAKGIQSSEAIAPYAAVPVPGGWLVFQL